MNKQKEITLKIPSINFSSAGSVIKKIIQKNIKLIIIVIVLLGVFQVITSQKKGNTVQSSEETRTETVQVDKSFSFPALDNSGKTTKDDIAFRIVDVQKTNKILVKDQTFTAKNNKTFLIINLEFKNENTKQLNILPGDLIRLSYDGNEENKFAPDLHNNLVPVAAISTKLDRVGFVVPQDSKAFKLYIGEIEEDKQEVEVNFPS